MTAPATVLLDGSGIDPAVAGGKGGALDELLGHGLQVPPTGVITTGTYRRFVRGPALADRTIMLGLTDGSTPSVEHHRRAIDGTRAVSAAS